MQGVQALPTSEIDRVFRAEYGRAVAVLVRVFGDIDIAEEAVQDAFVAAVRHWPSAGLPPSPAGWIITTARNRAIDRLRREASRQDRHAQAVLLQIRAEIKLQMVPYPGGSAQALSDVLGGRIDMVIEGHTGIAGAFQSGHLKPLAVASAQRLPDAPNLPTVAETIPGFIATGWQAVVVPKGTPEAVINKASADLRACWSSPKSGISSPRAVRSCAL